MAAIARRILTLLPLCPHLYSHPINPSYPDPSHRHTLSPSHSFGVSSDPELMPSSCTVPLDGAQRVQNPLYHIPRAVCGLGVEDSTIMTTTTTTTTTSRDATTTTTASTTLKLPSAEAHRAAFLLSKQRMSTATASTAGSWSGSGSGALHDEIVGKERVSSLRKSHLVQELDALASSHFCNLTPSHSHTLKPS